jgi:hypothetical protein
VDRGYRLGARADEIDLTVFETLTREGRRAIDRHDAVAADRVLSRALAMWRGRPFENLRPGPELDSVARRVEELWMTAQEDLFEAQLALGGHGHVAPAARRWVDANPLRERGWAQLALALYRSGDPASALAACAEARSVLAEELGLEPGPDLRRLQRAILERDESLGAGVASVAEVRPVRAPVPRQLPPAPVAFVGRRLELDLLERILDRSRPAGVPGIVAVHGPAGAGKSALATVAAHRVATQYPDGQLFVDFAGPGPRDNASLLGRLLLDLGQPAGHDAADPNEAVLRWRSVLAPRRVLIVLDNAESEAQIEPMLPAGTGCGVIVTSRHVFGGLPAACRVGLGPLGDADAVELIEQYAGPRSVRGQAAVRDLVRQCGGLPLALRRAASRLATRPEPVSGLLVNGGARGA